MELCDKSEENARASNVGTFVAGVVGFEPTLHATKKRCLTAWLHPNCEGFTMLWRGDQGKKAVENRFLGDPGWAGPTPSFS